MTNTFPVVLFLIFMVLKLTKFIDWSWWWITAPLWIPLTVAAAIWLMALLLSWVWLCLQERRKMKGFKR